MDEERTRSITMGSSHLEERQKGAVCTESSARLEALCQDGGWLEAFIRDTEEHQLLHPITDPITYGTAARLTAR